MVGTVGRDSGWCLLLLLLLDDERLEQRGGGGVALEQTVVTIIDVLLMVWDQKRGEELISIKCEEAIVRE